MPQRRGESGGSMARDDTLFDATPYWPALVLIRLPVRPHERVPAPSADFASGFFAGRERLVLTARHNLVDKKNNPFKWVWVCCYDRTARDWIDARRVTIDPSLLDEDADVGLLHVPGTMPGVLSLSLDWRRGDDVRVIGFVPRSNGMGFEPRPVGCMIPTNTPVDAVDIAGSLERSLRLEFTARALYENERVLKGFSGGPVVDLDRGAARVIAVEKAVQPTDVDIEPSRPGSSAGAVARVYGQPYALSTPLHWVMPLFDRLPGTMRVSVHSPEAEADSPFHSLVEEKTRDLVGRKFILAKLDAFLDAHDRGYFVITGEPGIGKTSLAAHLVKSRRYAHYFNDVLAGARTEHFLESVCLQLIERHQRGRHFDAQRDFLDGRYLNTLLEDLGRDRPAGERIVVVVDALDEAETAPAGANHLYLPARLPRGIYFVLTTRPLGDLALFVDCPRKDFFIEADSSENLTDVRSYVTRAASREALLTRIRAAQLGVDDFVETLVAKSEGNFMYLHYVLPEIARGETETDDLPQGLVGYYERHWRTMKSRDVDRWLKLQQPVICVLAAVREPVSVNLVADFIPGLTANQVASVIADWRPFLRETRVAGTRRYRLYHTSFQDFLKKKDEVGEVDLKQTHRSIANVLLADLEAERKNEA